MNHSTTLQKLLQKTTKPTNSLLSLEIPHILDAYIVLNIPQAITQARII